MARLLNIGVWLPVLVLLALGFAFWGWAGQAAALGLTWPDIFFRGVGSVAMSNNYDDRAFFNNDWRIDTARVLGGLAFILAASKAVARLFSTRASRWFGHFRTGHLLVVGHHPVARAVVEAAVRRRVAVTWLLNRNGDEADVPGALIIPGHWTAALAIEFGAARAGRCVVACHNEVEQVAAARDLKAAAPALPMIMHFGDPWFADLMDREQHISGVRFVSQAQLAVRDLHWRHPPFLAARKLGHRRIHALLFGFSRGGEAVLADLLLSAGTGFLERPRVTIVDPRADEIRRSLAQRCPALGESVDLGFVDPGIEADIRLLPEPSIAAAQAEDPITLTYVSVDGDNRAMALAVSLQALARREGWHIGAIFTRLVSGSARPTWRSDQPVPAPASLVSFGATQDFARAVDLFEAELDPLPRLFHEAYRRAVPGHAVANLPWDELTEEMRESNRRLAAHLPAKLASAGVDVERWIGAVDPVELGAHMPDLATNARLLDELAAIEHARWMAERHLSGWRQGPLRDNDRRIHPDLKPWADLDEHRRAGDRAMVAETWAALRESVRNPC